MAKVWADQPFSLIPTPTEAQTKGVRNLPPTILYPKTNQSEFCKEVIAVAREMCLAHNAMIRNINAIYLQCEQVTEPTDQADFIIFCQAAIEVIHTHHQMEETNFFPQVAEYTGEENIMQANIEQHRAFDAGLQIFEDHIYKLTPEKYDGGGELKRLLEGFAKVLVIHLSDEIQTLLALQKYGGDKLGTVFENYNKKVMASVKDKVCSSLSPGSNT
jgi:hemerythrin-like domain-containing protein